LQKAPSCRFAAIHSKKALHRIKYFAHCDERPKALPLETAIFWKKSSKTFVLEKSGTQPVRQTEGASREARFGLKAREAPPKKGACAPKFFSIKLSKT